MDLLETREGIDSCRAAPVDPRRAILAVRRRSQTEWADWEDEQLLDLRLSDLDLRIEGSDLEERIAELAAELEAKGLRFRPHFWLADEWFCPDGVPGIAIPFYLAHPRLRRLELTQVLEIEGGTREWCMMILRHEAGPRDRERLPAAPAAEAPGALRQELGALPRQLRRQALQPQLRGASRLLVRAEPPRRGLRRDLRGVAHARTRTGASATRAGRRCGSSSTWTS